MKNLTEEQELELRMWAVEMVAKHTRFFPKSYPHSLDDLKRDAK